MNSRKVSKEIRPPKIKAPVCPAVQPNQNTPIIHQERVTPAR